MNLVRFSPYRTVNRNLIDQLFSDFLRNDHHENYLNNFNRKPATNIIEVEEGFKIEMLVPGFKKEDIQLNYQDNILTVKVELPEKSEENEQKTQYSRREFDIYNFESKFRIPKTVNDERISAHFENGVLIIDLVKKEEALPKPPVEIKIN